MVKVVEAEDYKVSVDRYILTRFRKGECR